MTDGNGNRLTLNRTERVTIGLFVVANVIALTGLFVQLERWRAAMDEWRNATDARLTRIEDKLDQ